VSQGLQLRYYATAGIAAAIVLNLLLRTFVRLGGVFTTLLIAAAIAAGLALVFHWRQGRAPSRAERWRFTLLYGGVLALLYLGLLGMMYMQDTPSPMGLFLFSLHYLCYPLLAWWAFSPRWSR
jgi:drug/metabolite transporter (DMT)-like permease